MIKNVKEGSVVVDGIIASEQNNTTELETMQQKFKEGVSNGQLDFGFAVQSFNSEISDGSNDGDTDDNDGDNDNPDD